MIQSKKKILGVILAGGLSRRMGGKNKFLKKINNNVIIDLIIERAKKQVDKLIINVNNEIPYLSKFNLSIIPDIVKGYKGPLAGVLSGMSWAKKQSKNIDYIATFACDAPFFPKNLVQNLLSEIKNDNLDIIIPKYNGQKHPVFGIWSVDLIDSLKKYIVEDDLQKVDTWIIKHKFKILDFKNLKYDPFFNINTPEELSKANIISLKFNI